MPCTSLTRGEQPAPARKSAALILVFGLRLGRELDTHRGPSRLGGTHGQIGHRSGGKEWLAKSLIKIVATSEVRAAVLLGLGQQPMIHHVENHLAKILAPAQSPFVEHHQRHRTKLIQRVVAQSTQQFLPFDMAHHAALLAFGDTLLGVIQSFTKKMICAPRKTRIRNDDSVQHLVKTRLFHSYSCAPDDGSSRPVAARSVFGVCDRRHD